MGIRTAIVGRKDGRNAATFSFYYLFKRLRRSSAFTRLERLCRRKKSTIAVTVQISDSVFSSALYFCTEAISIAPDARIKPHIIAPSRKDVVRSLKTVRAIPETNTTPSAVRKIYAHNALTYRSPRN